jgi:Flp pilus assembly protein TadD
VLHDAPDELLELGLLYTELDRPEDAERAWERARELAPHEPVASYRLGALWQSQGRIDDAVAAFQRAIAASPGAWEARNDLALVLLERNDEAAARQAVDLLRQARAAAPAEGAPAYNLALAHLTAGDAEAARGVLHEALVRVPAQDPMSDRIRELLARIDQESEA